MLWCNLMGWLEQYMDENFIKQAFSAMGEPIVNVKIICNRMTGTLAGYCFVELTDQASADRCLHKLNGKPLPGSNPPKKFKLNYATYGKRPDGGQEYSIFVGDLTPEVDDFELYHYFVKKYASCRGGKVVLDSRGKSRGFGFVRFADEAEQKKALDECQSGKGLGEKPIRISIAVPKSAKSKPEYQPNPSYNYSQYYQQYQNYYSQWGYDPYGSYNYSYPPYGSHEGPNMTSTAPSAEMPPLSEFQQNSTLAEETEEEPVEDPDPKLDVEEINKQFMEQSEELYDSLMNCHWQPLDTITSEIPTAV
ncbi:tRNA selenocysteine 1-associated protein 1-like isoform X1 [Callorhinchus milii]|uniref:tRNA selenocysteine-associated protein 1 n=1 Tax=Callorhinchus milii TaxID=7868 RepID=V9KXY5_CALMI|nr:tRNA selenocysteine 1-associated protein 1-like isoform X1 [Callorhinchus milii]|eukprot:gi/632965743/ref/XP_007899043.1/ PREDICTED: putative uncharacterized protein C6orf52 homolog isoform X1 [Callorhinchus milii]